MTSIEGAPEEADRHSSILFEAFGKLDDAVFLVEVETREILACNDRATSMFRCSREDLVGHDTRRFHVDDESFERFARIGMSALERDGVFRTEWSLRRADGERFPSEQTVVLVEDPRRDHAISIIRDIGERHEAQQRIVRSEARLRNILENILDVVWLFGAKGVIRFVSPSVERSLGYRSEDVVGKNAFELIHPDDRDTGAADIQTAVENPGRPIRSSVRIRHADGSWRLHQGTGQRTAGSDPPEVVVASRDVTERRRREKELRAQGAMFRALTESASEIVAILDAEGRIVYETTGHDRILGYDPDERAGTDPFEHVHPEDRDEVRRIFGTLLQESGYRIEGVEYRYRVADGSWRVLRSSARNMLDDPAVEGVVVSSHDVTERRRAEEALAESERQLRHAQRMETVGRLAGGVAHDFNNILTAIRGYAEIVRGSFDPDDERHAAVNEIIQGADRAATLTTQLLAYSRQQVLRPAPVELNDLVAGLEEMLGRLIGEDVELETRLDPDLHTIVADKGQLEQIVLNLAVNARDAMRGGDRLRIETERLDLDEPLEYDVGRVPVGSWAQLRVADTGGGISPDDMDRIFEPFFTTKPEGEGTGLGLSTVYGIVEQSGGTIGVRSEPGEGTTFDIYLPVREEGLRHPAGFQSMDDPETERGERILVVEDDDAVRSLAVTILRDRGFEVLEATDGEDALSMIDETERPIDLLVTDLVMPKTGGLELVRALRERGTEIPVLYMSGYSERRPENQDASTFLAKPFTPDELVARVRHHLDAAANDPPD